MATIREILVIPHTHHDIGYTHTPRACLEAHAGGIAEAMRLCEADLGDDSPTAFRWTVEIARPLIAFLRRADAAEVARLRRLVAADRLAVTAGYLHMTQLVGHEDSARSFLPVRELRERYGLPVSIVQHGDINGLSWGTVPLMRAAGLDCLVMALNPDHGRAPFEQPSAFIWEGQDGSRVLAWLSIHYGLGGLTDGGIARARDLIPGLVARLAARPDYPFDFLVVHAARDNMWPNRGVSEAVRAWNAAGHEPPMRLATIATAMERARAQAQTAPAVLPVVRGEWADWWAHGHGSSAAEVALGRRAQGDLRAAEAIRAAARFAAPRGAAPLSSALRSVPITSWYGPPVPAAHAAGWDERVRDAYDALLLWEEHTWGSFESVSNPGSDFTRSHWNEKAGFAYQAQAAARDLRREALDALVARLPAGPEPALVVVNPLAQGRDGVATVATDAGRASVVVRDLPPFGVKVLPWPEISGEPTESAVTDPPAVIANDFYRLEVDLRSAAIVRLYDKELDRELVDPAALTGLAGVVVESVDPADEHPAVRAHRRHFHPDTPGPHFVRTPATGTGQARIARGPGTTILTYDAAAPSISPIRTAITLYDELKWIDVTVHLRKDENPTMEGVYVLFPFDLNPARFLLETAGAVYEAGAEQLLDTCRDWYSVQHAVGVSDGTASVLWATREAPLVQLGGFHAGKWSRESPAASGHVASWLMNNLYFTNFRAAQGGELDVSFRFTTAAGDLDRSAVWRWGEAFAVPPLACRAPVRLGDYRWLDIAPGTVVARVATSAAGEEGTTLRVRETAGVPVTATIHWRGAAPVDLLRTDLLETEAGHPLAGDGRTFRLPLGAHELVTIAIRRRQEAGHKP